MLYTEPDGVTDLAQVNKFYRSYRDWTISSKFVGITEELGAKRCKHDAMSVADEFGSYALPSKPESFKALEDKLDRTDKFQNTLYRNLSND